jgi:hypothetical protein
MVTRDERRGRPLARPNPPPDADELEAELRRLLPPGTATRPPPQQEARDATGTVQVVVDARGQVEDVRIDQRWRKRLDPDGLLCALFDTYRAARSQAVAAFTMARFAAKQAGVEPPTLHDGPADRRFGSLSPHRHGADRAERWRRILQMRVEIQERRERRARIESEIRQPRDHNGPHGYLTATVQWGGIVGITGDAHLIQYADTEQLQQDALALLSLANRSPWE